MAGIAACWSPLVDLEAAGQLLGLALLAALLARIGWPADEPTTPAKRLGRVALVFAVYLLGRFGSHAWLQHFGDSDPVRLLLAATTTLFVLGSSIWLAKQLRLYPVA